ncbi:MAG: glycosyltransferase family 39 protein, partial [Nitrospirota bacterium]
MERMGFVLEPRIVENAAVFGYRLAGSEQLWIPRVISLAFWTVGAVFFYLTARILFPFGVALFCTVFYLFLPYSILSSRIFQPDPLMVMLMLVSIYGIIKYDESPGRANLFIVALVSSAAVLVKPYCVFIIFGAFFSLVVLRGGFWKAVFNRRTFMFGFLIILPSIIYYGYSILMNVGFLGEHAKGSFLPGLIITVHFWMGWLNMIGRVVGYIVFF